MNWNRFKAFFFDLDDTLINTRESIRAGWKAALQHPDLAQNQWVQESGFNIVENLCVHFSSNAYHEYWKAFAIEVLPKKTDSTELEKSLCARYEDAYWENLAPFPSVLKCLKSLQTLNKTQVLITNGILDFQLQKLKHTQLFPFFENLIFCSEDFPFDHKKPSPIMIQTALRQLQCNKNDTVFLGNAPIDIIAGNLAQVSTIAVANISNPCALKLNTPDASLHSWEVLKEALIAQIPSL